MEEFKKAKKIYMSNRDVEDFDYSEIVQLLEYAASLDVVEACDMIGDFYANGRGLKLDHDKAFEYWEKAAKKGYPWSMYSLGRYFEFVKKNKPISRYWFRKGAEKGLLCCKISLENCD